MTYTLTIPIDAPTMTVAQAIAWKVLGMLPAGTPFAIKAQPEPQGGRRREMSRDDYSMKPGIYYCIKINRTKMYRHDTLAQAKKAQKILIEGFSRANLFPKVEILKCDTNGKHTIWEVVS